MLRVNKNRVTQAAILSFFVMFGLQRNSEGSRDSSPSLMDTLTSAGDTKEALEHTQCPSARNKRDKAHSKAILD